MKIDIIIPNTSGVQQASGWPPLCAAFDDPPSRRGAFVAVKTNVN